MERLRLLPAILCAAALLGCGPREITSADIKPKDPYAGMTPQQKIDAIRQDPKINSMQKAGMISDAQKAAGLPVTGQ
jgi:hypothetical protein